MIGSPREDAYCPACPDPETAFRLENVGMKIEHEEPWRIKATRPVWEPLMLEHLRSRLDDPEHQRIYDLCVTALMAAETTAEGPARAEVQAVTDSIRRTLENGLRHLRGF